MIQNKTFGFPFTVNSSGRIDAIGGDEAIRGKIIQVLFTAPGERVNNPDFGCGLFNLIFEPNNEILAASIEFTVAQALIRWLDDEIQVNNIDVVFKDENIAIEIAYTKKSDLSKQAVRIHFR